MFKVVVGHTDENKTERAESMLEGLVSGIIMQGKWKTYHFIAGNHSML